MSGQPQQSNARRERVWGEAGPPLLLGEQDERAALALLHAPLFLSFAYLCYQWQPLLCFFGPREGMQIGSVRKWVT
jgi:hypothetical protein